MSQHNDSTQVRSYKVPAEVKSGDPTITLPIEVQHEQDGYWYAVYDGERDVEYPDLQSLIEDHDLCVAYPPTRHTDESAETILGVLTADAVAEWDVYSWQRTSPRELAASLVSG